MESVARGPGVARKIARYVAALGVVGIATAIGLSLFGHVNSPSISLLYLLGVVLVGLYLRHGPALFAALTSAIAFNFFFTEPRWALRIDRPSELVAFFTLLAVGLIVASLSARMRRHARLAQLREEQAADLSAFAEALLGAEDEDSIAAVAANHIGKTFAADVELLIGDVDGMRPDGPLPASSCVEYDTNTLRQVVIDGLPVVVELGGHNRARLHYVPVMAPHRMTAVLLALTHRSSAAPDDDVAVALGNHARQIALALDRSRYAQRAQQAALNAQLAQSRRDLLAGLSHDLRTPLATLVGASSALLARSDMASEASRDLLLSIHEESQRMSRLTDNVLYMARLVAGASAPHAEWIPLDELIGSARRELREFARGRNVAVTISPPLTAIYVDAMLFERVMVNLIDNALKYSAPETSVEIHCRYADAASSAILLAVLDRGTGVPAAVRRSMFDAFVRGAPEGPQSGVGLGLALCRVIVELHRGRLWFEDRAGGGSVFWISLPQPAEGGPTLPADPPP